MRAIVIVANGWNAGWAGCLGNEWAATPNLDRLAAESIVFDQHFATNPASGNHFRSVLSGCYEFSWANDHPRANLLRSLRNYGVRTVSVRDVDASGFHGSADEWDETLLVAKNPDVSRGEALYGLVAEKLEELADVEDWLVWIETDRLLPPWSVPPDFFEEYARDLVLSEDEKQVPEPWANPPQGAFDLNGGQFEQLHGTFAAMVSEWDAELGEWFDLFRELGLEESAVWAVTSGFGLALGEHDWIGPQINGLFEETVHVPLILRLPGADEAGRRVPFLSESIDLLPTLCDAFGHTIGESIQGTSLLPLVGGSFTPLKDVVVQGMRGADNTEWALRTLEWAFLFSEQGHRPPLLFRKPEDRWEVNDVRQHHLEWAEHLEATLRKFIQNAGQPSYEAPKLREYRDVVGGVK